MESYLAQEAISAALSCDWEKAILINSKILKIDSKNIDALNRIARAYAEKGEIEKAKKFTTKVLKIDPANTIAGRCHLKWQDFKPVANSRITKFKFIEEPTRTKVVNLINLGEKINITNLDCGDTLKLDPHTHRVNVLTMDDNYIGRFPDDLALKFISLVKLGGSYEVVVKTANTREVKVFVRALSKNGL